MAECGGIVQVAGVLIRGGWGLLPRVVRPETFQRKENQRHPDQPKTDEVRRGERFFIDEYAQQKLHGGGDVLQDANRRKRDTLRGG